VLPVIGPCTPGFIRRVVKGSFSCGPRGISQDSSPLVEDAFAGNEGWLEAGLVNLVFSIAKAFLALEEGGFQQLYRNRILILEGIGNLSVLIG
jgi:hypothetical protein